MRRLVTLPWGRVREYVPKHPERTATKEQRPRDAFGGMIDVLEYPNRDAMVNAIYKDRSAPPTGRPLQPWTPEDRARFR